MQASVPVRIERVVAGGWGLAHVGSMVTFVRGTIPGETVRIATQETHHRYQVATLSEVLEASAERVQPACGVYGHCGGCQFQHVKYEAQLIQKQRLLEEALSRIGRVSINQFEPPMPSPLPYEYRSWVRFTVFRERGGFHLGFRRERSHQAVPAAGCMLVPKSMRRVVEEIEIRLATLKKLPVFLSSVELRSSSAFGNTLIIFRGMVSRQEEACLLFQLFKGLPTVVGQVFIASPDGSSRRRPGLRWVEGDDHLSERFHKLVVRISDRAFMPANWSVYETIAQSVAEWMGSPDRLRVLALFSGIGCLGLFQARNGALVTEVEENPFALADARKSASMNHVGRCRFRHAKAETYLSQVAKGDYDWVIVDPPRVGLSRECVESLGRIKAPGLLYLSCDAQTLARDLGRLCESGYRIVRAKVFDMFPQTAHVETLVQLAYS